MSTDTLPTETVDSTADEIHDDPTQTAALVRRERRSEVIRPLNADELVQSFADYQSLLPKLLDGSDWQGTPGGRGSFVKKSGWRKIATAFDLDVQIVRSEVERDDAGHPVRAEVWARAVAPSGRFMEGDGYCSVDESRFERAGGRQKLENDLRATATTRAMNRAISGLVGMGAVSAEEVDSTPAQSAGLPYGEAAPAELVDKLGRAVGELMGHHPAATATALAKIQHECGYTPRVVARCLLHLAVAHRETHAPPPGHTTPNLPPSDVTTPEQIDAIADARANGTANTDDIPF